MALPAAAAQADATWTGASTTSSWSDTGNWQSGTPPNSATGTLSFPTLGTCGSCYTSDNNLPGVSTSTLVLGNNTSQYQITGNSFTVGTGGIADSGGGNTGDVINAPVALTGASQPWVVGSSSAYNNLTFLGGVSGSGTAVTIGTPHLSDLFIDSDMEVGPVVSNGPGTLHIGGKPGSGTPGSINGTDGQPFTVNGGTLIPNPSSTSGPLTMNSGTTLKLGTFTTNTHATTLQVDGPASLSSTTSTQAFINANGSTPGTDFSQLSASGDIAIGGQLLIGHGPNNSGSCVALNPGDVATLVTTAGTLSGTFSGVPDGAVVNLTGSPCTGGGTKVQINYTSNSVTATVLGASTPTTTTLAAPSPSPAATNQAVTLTATVSTSSVTPSGTVAFSANGSVISGCNAQPVTTGGSSSATATCTTSFAASGSPESLTAAFTPSNGSGQTGSSSSAQNLTVGQGTTATTLVASSTTPEAGGTVTYTAAVSPGLAGPTEPSGTVAFLAGGSAISGCTARPLAAGAVSSTATCTVSYPGAGSYAITAAYGGDGNFTGSASAATMVAVNAGAGGRSPGISATTSRATGVGTTQATLNGRLSTGGAAATWKFEFGRSAAYGQVTAVHTVAAGQTGSVAVSAFVKGLSPDVLYHYRLVVTAGSQTANTKDTTVTTKATGQLAGPRGQVAVIRGTILISARCQSDVLCRGRFSSTTTAGTGKHRKLVRCASVSLLIRAHRSAGIRVRLNASCLRLLRDQPRRRLTVNATTESQTGQAGQIRRITLVLK